VVPRRPAGISIAGFAAIITSLKDRHPLIAIFRERRTPDEVEIGRVVRGDPTGVWINRVTTEARIEAATDYPAVAAITRIGFGGEYERSLALVAGLTH
jgi:hypothetical protein